jgi:histidine triad (HIT) family protein
MRFELDPYGVCSFCQDLDGQRRSAFVIRDETAAVLVNERQYERGAMPVIPTRHLESVLDITEAEVQAVYCMAKRVAEAAVRAFGAVGMYVYQNNRRVVGQTEPHFHVHVVLRYPTSDPRCRFHHHEYTAVSLEEQEAVAAAVRAAL